MSKLRSLSSARYDGEQVINGDTSDEFASVAYDTIINKLSDEFEPCRFNDRIELGKFGLIISCTLQRLEETKTTYSAEMLFFITHDLFDEPLCEYSQGMGPDASAAVASCTEQFITVVLYSVLTAFGCEGDHTVTAEYGGRDRTFRRSCTALTYSIGACDHEQVDLFSIIEKQLPEYLGAKKAYWLKLYAVCYNDEVSCEVRINGAVMPELSKRLYAYTELWQNRQRFHSEKQFILLLDEDRESTNTPVPPEKVISLACKSIELLGKVTSERTHDIAMKNIRELCMPHATLAHELRAMIPEIYTCRLLGLRQGDDLKLMLGDAEITLKKSQLRIFGYIEQGVGMYLNEKAPTNDLSMNILRMSSLFSAVNEAVQNGAEINDIFIKELKFRYPADYILD